MADDDGRGRPSPTRTTRTRRPRPDPDELDVEDLEEDDRRGRRGRRRRRRRRGRRRGGRGRRRHARRRRVRKRAADEEEEDDDDDLLSPDDVEADLDRILKDRMVTAEEDEDEEDEEVEPDDRGDAPTGCSPSVPTSSSARAASCWCARGAGLPGRGRRLPDLQLMPDDRRPGARPGRGRPCAGSSTRSRPCRAAPCGRSRRTVCASRRAFAPHDRQPHGRRSARLGRRRRGRRRSATAAAASGVSDRGTRVSDGAPHRSARATVAGRRRPGDSPATRTWRPATSSPGSIGSTAAELAAIRPFEVAHRGRRTVLGKIDQLLAHCLA